MTGTVDTKLENGVLTLRLSNPEARNALGHSMARALHERLHEAAVDQRVRAIVLTGAGDAFCVGADVRQIGAAQEDDPLAVLFASQDSWNSLEVRGRRVAEAAQRFALLHTIAKPTIAVLNGPAAGAGMSLALACDFRLAADTAMLTTAFTKLGTSGDLGIGYYLVRLVGLQKARELLYFSERIGAADALAMGLVDRIFSAAELPSASEQFARRLAEGPPIAYHYLKRNLEIAQTATLHEYLAAESQHQVRCFSTQDSREAVDAFRQKRKPSFQGR